MKLHTLILFLGVVSTAVCAQQRIRPDGEGGWTIEDTGSCSGLGPNGQALCLGEQEGLRRERIQQQILLQQQQVENQRLKNEILRKNMEREQEKTQARQQPTPADNTMNPEFQAWKVANPWFQRDRAKTEFSWLYAKQLRQDRPDLIGRAFYDAVSAKVEETFGAGK